MNRFLLLGALAVALGGTNAAAQVAPVTPRQPGPAARPAGNPTSPAVAASTAGVRALTPARSTRMTILPGTRESAFTTILGNALNSSNGALPNNVVRLRDARLGRIVDSQLTDQAGLFTFRTIDPGSYIVELMGPSQSVLAASQILNVTGGEAVSAVVKLPFRIPPFAGLMGQTSASAASRVIATAASSGVMGAVAPGTAVSP